MTVYIVTAYTTSTAIFGVMKVFRSESLANEWADKNRERFYGLVVEQHMVEDL